MDCGTETKAARWKTRSTSRAAALIACAIPQVTFQDFQIALESFQVFAFPGGKVIQNADGSALPQEFFHDMRTDESGSAGDQGTHTATCLETQ